jgi:hypothetical protein
MTLFKGFGKMPLLSWKQERERVATKLIRVNELTIAATAWQFYQKPGLGYLVLMPKKEAKPGEPIPCYYYFKGSEFWEKAKQNKEAAGGSYAKLHAVVDYYNPETELVVMVSFTELPPREHWLVKNADIAPPLAYAESQSYTEDSNMIKFLK